MKCLLPATLFLKITIKQTLKIEKIIQKKTRHYYVHKEIFFLK